VSNDGDRLFRAEPDERRANERPPVRIGESLGRLVRHLGWAEEVRSVGLLARWAEIVGPAIAAHTRPLALEGTTLVVAVDDPAWASQLRWLEEDLLAQLAEAGGGQIDRLVLRVRGRR